MVAGCNFLVTGEVTSRAYPIAASQTFVAGDHLTSSSGAMAIAVAAGNNLTSELIAGIALSPAISPETGALAPYVDVAIAVPDSLIFGLNMYNATAANSVANPATQLGKSYGMRHDADRGWCVNNGDDTNDKVRVLDFFKETLPTWPNATTAGTTQYAWTYCTFLSAACFLSGTRAAT